MNTPLIITEMNKPGSIIISSSAPSLPRCPPLPPQPYFCLFIHATGWAGRGRAGGARGGRGVSTVWQHGPGNGVRWAPGRPPVCLCAHGRESTCRFSTCVNARLCPGCKHICVCAGGWAQPAGGCRAVQTPDAVSAGPPAGAGEREAEPVLRRRVTAGVSDVWLRIHARAQLCLSLCESVVHTHQHVCVWAQVCECVSVGVGLGCHVWRRSSVQGACVAANGLSGCT